MLYGGIFVRGTRNRTLASVTASYPLARNQCQVLILSRCEGFCCSPCESVVYRDAFSFAIIPELKKAKIDNPRLTLLF